MKAYTDIEQSKKLAEILSHESADGTWVQRVVCGEALDMPEEMQYIHQETPFRLYSGIGIPCWSLAALLDILPTIDDRNAEFCKDIRFDKWHIYYHGTATLPLIGTNRYENLVDACYEMILNLNCYDYGKTKSDKPISYRSCFI